VGNRPIKLRKSTWGKRDLSVQRKKPKFKRKAAAAGVVFVCCLFVCGHDTSLSCMCTPCRHTNP
jgi:hypothetical protein